MPRLGSSVAAQRVPFSPKTFSFQTPATPAPAPTADEAATTESLHQALLRQLTSLFDFASAPTSTPATAPAQRADEAPTTESLDEAVLRELAKKCKTLDPSEAEIIDPLDYDGDGAYELETEPKLTIVPNFLTDEECAHLRSLAESRWAPSLIITAGANGETKDLKQQGSELRTSWSTPVDYAQTPIVKDIEQRLSKLVGMSVNHLERLAMVRYEPGQQYKIHHDGIWRPMTAFIYLNDIPSGDEGETFFPNLDIKIMPRKGALVMWPNTDGKRQFEDIRVMHAGLPPKSGTKYGVNCFFNEAPKRLMPDNGTFGGQGPPEPVRAPAGAVGGALQMSVSVACRAPVAGPLMAPPAGSFAAPSFATPRAPDKGPAPAVTTSLSRTVSTYLRSPSDRLF